MNRSAVRRAGLRVVRGVGGFDAARWATRHDLRILCYHGFAIHDEHRFRPGLFITAESFERRLAHLRDARYHVLSLREALARRRDGTLPPRSVCITIDDGFYGTLSIAAPLLQRYGMPATLYLTTYYVVHPAPIPNLTIAYMLWRTRREVIDLRGLGIPGLPETPVPWSTLDGAARDRIVGTIVTHLATRLTHPEQQALLDQVGERTGVSLREIVDGRYFDLVTEAEARAIQAFGISLEYHTHRHRSPGTRELGVRELVDNRAVLDRVAVRPPGHFCYPSGRFDRWADAWLEELDIESGTTTHPGFVRPDTPRYQLGRFLDGENIDQPSFEAELAGVLELARRARAAVGRAAPPVLYDDPAEAAARAAPPAGA